MIGDKCGWGQSIKKWKLTQRDYKYDVGCVVVALVVKFALVIWYLEKTIPTLQELSIYSSKSSSKYFSGDKSLVGATKGGLEYCTIQF